ncbi:hypothetical protein ACLKA7_000075 [Drosophila subpalustris]
MALRYCVFERWPPDTWRPPVVTSLTGTRGSVPVDQPLPPYSWDQNMDANKTNITPKEAEQPHQSEVTDLSTKVEPMDAEDSYSSVSNSNIEEIEELLRVEEEILNSPPKAEPASSPPKWCCSEAPSTLPGS